MSTKERLDVALVARGLAETRAKAQASIMSGIVYVNGQKVDKAGTPVAADAALEVRGHTLRYVSRGGLKLEKAMAEFPITLTDCICADIGASTGGFTDCMLQNGAKKVYAVDVGYGQLDWKLRQDARVTVLEKNDQPGGRARVFKDKGYTFDGGPTVSAGMLPRKPWAYITNMPFQFLGTSTRYPAPSSTPHQRSVSGAPATALNGRREGSGENWRLSCARVSSGSGWVLPPPHAVNARVLSKVMVAAQRPREIVDATASVSLLMIL